MISRRTVKDHGGACHLVDIGEYISPARATAQRNGAAVIAVLQAVNRRQAQALGQRQSVQRIIKHLAGPAIVTLLGTAAPAFDTNQHFSLIDWRFCLIVHGPLPHILWDEGIDGEDIPTVGITPTPEHPVRLRRRVLAGLPAYGFRAGGPMADLPSRRLPVALIGLSVHGRGGGCT